MWLIAKKKLVVCFDVVCVIFFFFFFAWVTLIAVKTIHTDAWQGIFNED